MVKRTFLYFPNQYKGIKQHEACPALAYLVMLTLMSLSEQVTNPKGHDTRPLTDINHMLLKMKYLSTILNHFVNIGSSSFSIDVV